MAKQLSVKASKEKEKGKVVHIPKVSIDVVTGELSDILGHLLDE